MRRRSLRAFVIALCLGVSLIFVPTAHAQIDQSQQNDLADLRRALRFIGNEYADNYVQPITDAFGANMHGGYFRTADVGNGFLPLFPFEVYVGVSVSGVMTNTVTERFSPPATEEIQTPGDGRIEIGFTEGTDTDVPTAFGDTDTPDATLDVVSIQEISGVRDTLLSESPPPGLVDTRIAPLPMPQVGLGSLFGTDVQVRYFPESNVYGYGEVALFGVSVRHDVDQWIPAPLPLNIAVQGSWNQFSMASEGADGQFQEVLDASGWALNLQVSKGVPVLPVVFYGGAQYERFSTSYDYEFDPPNIDEPIDIELDQDAANTFRGLAGITFNIPPTPVRLNVDYAVGSNNNVVTAGFGVKL